VTNACDPYRGGHIGEATTHPNMLYQRMRERVTYAGTPYPGGHDTSEHSRIQRMEDRVTNARDPYYGTSEHSLINAWRTE
jgi:hypothetical protein